MLFLAITNCLILQSKGLDEFSSFTTVTKFFVLAQVHPQFFNTQYIHFPFPKIMLSLSHLLSDGLKVVPEFLMQFLLLFYFWLQESQNVLFLSPSQWITEQFVFQPGSCLSPWSFLLKTCSDWLRVVRNGTAKMNKIKIKSSRLSLFYFVGCKILIVSEQLLFWIYATPLFMFWY